MNILIDALIKDRRNSKGRLPSKVKTDQWLNRMTEFLFPAGNPCLDKNTIEKEYEYICKDLQEILKSISEYLLHSPEKVTNQYFGYIKGIYELLKKDAAAMLEFDPAANSMEEVITTYPGFYAIMVYRLAHPLYVMGLPFLSRFMTEYAHSKTGIDIHPGAEIGESFFIDHGTGVVIGETTEIGKNVKIYQGVTLGALSVKKELSKIKRHPTIEDHVIIYSGATILGGKTIVGKGSVIGGNAWLTRSTAPGTVVYNDHKAIVKDEKATANCDFTI